MEKQYMYETSSGLYEPMYPDDLPLVKEYHEPSGMVEQKNGTIWIKGGNLFARYWEKRINFNWYIMGM